MSSVIVPVISVIDGCWVRLSYTYSLVFAADMYATVFKPDPLDPVRGAKYREAILRPGGSREEDDSLKVTDLFSVSPWGTAASNTIDTSTGIPRAAAELRGVRARTIRTRRVQPLSLSVMDYHSSVHTLCTPVLYSHVICSPLHNLSHPSCQTALRRYPCSSDPRCLQEYHMRPVSNWLPSRLRRTCFRCSRFATSPAS